MAEPTHILLASQVLTSGTTSIILSNLSGDYRDLFIKIGGPGGGQITWLQFNGVETNDYAFGQLSANNGDTGTYNTHQVNQDKITTHNAYPWSSGSLGQLEIWVIDYKNTNKWKTTLARFTHGAGAVTLNGGRWESNSAINEITIGTTSNSIATGTQIEIYGVGI